MQGLRALVMPVASPPPAHLARRRPDPVRRRARHRRPSRPGNRWHRLVVAYRDIDFLAGPNPPDDDGGGVQDLLLVHVRKVVGRVTYRICAACATGTITAVEVDDPLVNSGLPTRAVAHLRSRYPDLAWTTTLQRRLTRDLFRRMRVLATADSRCPHG
ncbi:hypothetical protein [Streptomyces lavendofoliae]|uniref:hypothetical protein n=1 Tax=Streptomyces lavendofoliae TaxID=67314 RepID=UPI00300F2FE9